MAVPSGPIPPWVGYNLGWDTPLGGIQRCLESFTAIALPLARLRGCPRRWLIVEAGRCWGDAGNLMFHRAPLACPWKGTTWPSPRWRTAWRTPSTRSWTPACVPGTSTSEFSPACSAGVRRLLPIRFGYCVDPGFYAVTLLPAIHHLVTWALRDPLSTCWVGLPEKSYRFCTFERLLA